MDKRPTPFVPALGGPGRPQESQASEPPPPSVERMLRAIWQKVNELEARQTQWHGELLDRLGELEERFDDLEPTSLDDLENQLDDLQRTVSNLESTLGDVESTLSSVESTVNNIESTVDNL